MKKSIVNTLNKAGKPLSLKELVQHLPSSMTERTLRRLLAELNKDGLVHFVGANRNRRYVCQPFAKSQNAIQVMSLIKNIV